MELSQHKNFKVLRSSAGSGKTYALAINFISIALVGAKNTKADYYKKILAMTFTNKAANEMKERVLNYLDILSNRKDKDNILQTIIEETNLNKEEVFNISKQIRNHILHNYSELRISTIDKFTYGIVRTFAKDLQLNQNFELEMDSYKIIQPVVSLLLSRISKKGGDLSNALVEFAMQKAEDGKSTNIERDLEEFAAQIFKESSLDFINNSTLNVSDCMEVRKELLIQKDKCADKILDLADQVCEYFEVKGLSQDHFKGGSKGGFYNFFTKNIINKQTDFKWLPSDAVYRDVYSDVWYAKSKSQEIKDLVDSSKEDLVNFFNILMTLISEYISCKAILKNIYSIAVLNELIIEVNSYKINNNIEQISEFNKKIHSIIVEQPSSFIYERIGERYNHFLIDEFQDTSVLQWQNILPLITDTIDTGKSMVVGDGKQSIYRWRGGEVEQFHNLPNIYKGNKLKFKKQWQNKLKQHYSTNVLANNYRSQYNIIDFNNKFFELNKNILSPDLLGIYNNHKQNLTKANKGGYVHVELLEREDFKQNVIDRLIEEIKEMTSNPSDINYKDIAILCNSRTSVSLVSNSLMEEKIDVISNDGLLLCNSDKVNFLISILYYLADSNNNVAKASIISFLVSNFSYSGDIHTKNKEIALNTKLNEILKDFNIEVNFKNILKLSLYELVEELISSFEIDEDIYINFFLDIVLKYFNKYSSNISEFLLWWEEKKTKESIVIPEGVDAVQVMTIHKSKGLAFNIVMIPFNWEDKRNYSEIWVDTSEHFSKKLKSALIMGSKKLKHSYYSKEQEQEKNLELLDNINKLYVAMTRAKNALYVFTKKFPDKINDKFTCSGKLNSFMYNYHSEEYPLIIGDNIQINSEEDISKQYTKEKFEKLKWKKIISLKTASELIWDLENHSSKKDWGKLLHYALSKVVYKDDLMKVLNYLLSSGICSVKDKEDLFKHISALINHKQISKFFDKKWEVRTECAILLSNGNVFIPDRFIFDNNQTIIIDYKTGVESIENVKQIQNYSDILSSMGYKNIESYLIYINKDTVKLIKT